MTEANQQSTMRWSVRRTLWFGLWILLALFVAYLASGIYSIESSQVGVLLRFGAVIDDSIPPGIHYKFPWPIDSIVRVPVRKVMRLSIDDFYENSSLADTFLNLTGLASYLISGDNNIVTVNCVLQYTIQEPAKYLYSLTNNERTLRSMACNTLIHSMAGTPIDDILTIGKTKIRLYVKRELQRRLDELDSGLSISFVELQEVRPPDVVQEYFNDVINSLIDKDKMINTALSYQNEQIPKAKADADRLIRDSEAYQNRVITKAQGDTERFLSQFVEYDRNRDVTRQRLYLEFLQEVLPKLSRKVVIAREGEKPLVRVITPNSRR